MSIGGAPYREGELDLKARRALERVSENLHVLANEPSLAFYRLQEHVRKSLPVIVDKRSEVNRLHEELQGRCYDVDYAVTAVTSICNAKEPFDNCKELLKNAIFFKQQLRHQETRKQRKSLSMYKRFSSHVDQCEEAGAAIKSRPQSNIYPA